MNPECACVLIVVLQVCGPNSDILALSEPSELEVEDLAEPYLVALINHPDLTRVVIYLEELNYLDLQVEIIILVLFVLVSYSGDINQLCNILICQHYNDIR